MYNNDPNTHNISEVRGGGVGYRMMILYNIWLSGFTYLRDEQLSSRPEHEYNGLMSAGDGRETFCTKS